MATTTPSPKDTRLIPVPRWNEFHLWPPQGGLRYLIFNASKNGFDAVLRRCGRRLLIDEAAFFQWMKSSSRKKQTSSKNTMLTAGGLDVRRASGKKSK